MEKGVDVGRALIADSLGFHLLIIIFGVGMPVLISALELFGIITHRPRARELAHIWAKALTILFILGAISGTLISLQFDLLWPKFMKFIGKTAGVAFVLEGTMFMIEAVFLSVYMLTWKRFSPVMHWLCSLPVVIGSVGSAVFITSANAFMNDPRGFSLDKAGNPVNINIAHVLFTPTMWAEVLHSIPAYLVTSALVILSIYIWLYLKKRHSADRPWMKKVIVGLSIYALFWGIMVGLAGHLSAKNLAANEPYKLAAAEALTDSQSHAPLIIGGIIHGEGVTHAITIPNALSILAGNHADTWVVGLSAFGLKDCPPVFVHYFFDSMVLLGILIVIIPLLFLLLYKFRRSWSLNRGVLIALLACGPFAVLATELGWMLTEFGRQPYAIHGYLRTDQAFTTNQAVIHLGYLFPTGYLVLLTLAIFILRRTSNHASLKEITNDTN